MDFKPVKSLVLGDLYISLTVLPTLSTKGIMASWNQSMVTILFNLQYHSSPAAGGNETWGFTICYNALITKSTD